MSTPSINETYTAYIALSFHAYGWGDDAAEAQRNCRGNVGQADLKKHGMVTYRVHPKSELSLIDGSISYPQGCPPIKIADTRPVTWTKAEGKAYKVTIGRQAWLLVYQPQPMQMWQVLDGTKLLGATGNVGLKEAKAYAEKLLKGL